MTPVRKVVLITFFSILLLMLALPAVSSASGGADYGPWIPQTTTNDYGPWIPQNTSEYGPWIPQNTNNYGPWIPAFDH